MESGVQDTFPAVRMETRQIQVWICPACGKEQQEHEHRHSGIGVCKDCLNPARLCREEQGAEDG